MKLFEILHQNTNYQPNRVIWEDDTYGEYTFSDINESSARLYAYFDAHSIGTEDIVAIRMKRNARIFLVMLGIWKAGAAFVVIGEHSPEAYVTQVLRDTEPKMLFDDDCFEQAMLCCPKEGYHPVDEHDLACIVYSTGSSGVFKGSMHEYGAVTWVENKFVAAGANPLYNVGYNAVRGVSTNGFYSIAVISEMLWAIYLGYYFYILPYDAIFDFQKYINSIQSKKIETVCVAPSMYQQLLGRDLPYVSQIDFSYDVPIDAFMEGYRYSNSYALTEGFGMIVSSYIEKSADIIPVGKPCPLTQVMLTGDDGNEVQQGNIGEICFVPVCFRGYKNRPELTDKVYYDGWFHTGDMAYINADGDYVVVGRKMDMMETPNGYIVPVFVSVAVKKAFPAIQKNYVKLFGDVTNPKICVYYIGDTEYSINDFQTALAGRIPNYMLPTHCRKMKQFEYFPCGKINRLTFEEPF